MYAHRLGRIVSSTSSRSRTPAAPAWQREPRYVEGLKDLDGFSHLILLYHFDRAGGPVLTVVPFTDDAPRGVFSTRHPQRPNPIGLSIVRLVRVEGVVLHLEDVDVLDGTPLLDIKPYVPRFDAVENAAGGWTRTVGEETARQRGLRNFRRPGQTGMEERRNS